MREAIKISLSQGNQTCFIDDPEVCPICKGGIKPVPLHNYGYYDNSGSAYVVSTFLCRRCFKPFIALYEILSPNPAVTRYETRLISVEPQRHEPRVFDARITSVSPSFVEIYNQARAAEAASLDQIAGMGYRKALEFLIKDYLINKFPDEADAIKGMPLAACISQKVQDPHLRIVASRCAWLGNDHSHYVQKFTEYDLRDLDRLLELSVHWIMAEILTEEAQQMDSRP